MHFLSNPPLRREWLDGHPAYESTEGDLVRAHVALCREAFKAGGFVASDPSVIASICRLREERVLAMWDLLMDGWVVQEDGRLKFAAIAVAAQDFQRANAQALQAVSEQISGLEAQASLEFDGHVNPVVRQAPIPATTVAAAQLTKPGRRPAPKRGLPDDFGLTPELEKWLSEERGIGEPYHHKFLMDGFIFYAKAKQPLYADWEAAFKQNIDMALRTGRELPSIPATWKGERKAAPVAVQTSPRMLFGAQPAARQEAVRQAAEGVFARASARDGQRWGQHG